MPYEAGWLIQDRVMIIRYAGVLSSEDVRQYLEETLAMRDEANARLGENGPLVHTITDATRLESYSLKMADIQKMLKSLRTQRVGWSIFVHPAPSERFWASLGQQWAGVRHREFNTMSTALEFLRIDTTLPADEIDRLLAEFGET